MHVSDLSGDARCGERWRRLPCVRIRPQQSSQIPYRPPVELKQVVPVSGVLSKGCFDQGSHSAAVVCSAAARVVRARRLPKATVT